MDKKMYIGIIYNLNSSGLTDESIIYDLTNVLKSKYDCIVVPMKSKYPGHISKLAKDSCRVCDIIISIGGDGTFDHVIKGIYNEKDTPIFIHLPMGTANDLAKTFMLSNNPVKNLKNILDGKVTTYDILTINDVPYAYVAAFGFLVSVASDTPSKWKKKMGKNAYILYGSREALKKPEPYNIEYNVNNENYEKEIIFGAVSNSMGFGGLELYDDVKANDGLFEVLLVPNILKIEMAKVLADVAVNKKKLSKANNILYYRTNKLNMKFSKPLSNCWNLDGESSNIDNEEITIKVGKQIKVMVTNEAYENHFIKE